MDNIDYINEVDIGPAGSRAKDNIDYIILTKWILLRQEVGPWII